MQLVLLVVHDLENYPSCCHMTWTGCGGLRDVGRTGLKYGEAFKMVLQSSSDGRRALVRLDLVL